MLRLKWSPARLILLLLFVGLSIGQAQASFLDTLKRGSLDAPDQQSFIPAEQAFVLSSEPLDAQTIRLTWTLPKGYFLYRHAFKFTAAHGTTLGDIQLPEGVAQYDEYLGDYQVYFDSVQIDVSAKSGSNGLAQIVVHYQGCAASGYCYPPMSDTIEFAADNRSKVKSASPQPAADGPEIDPIAQLLESHHIGWTMIAFIGFGLLLSFTPCVLPMLPIISSIVAGQGKQLSRRRGFILAIIYTQAVALSFGIAGALAGKAGESFQTLLQTPWAFSLMALLFVLLALSMFGYYELRLPASFEQRLQALSRSQQSGTYVGVLIMGILSAFIVSPCVSPPLFAALAYISQSGDAWYGGLALYGLGLGMGLPIIVLMTLGGHLLPKAGKWMESIKFIFGVLLLGLAITMLGRFLGHYTLFLWAGLLLGCAVFLNIFTTQTRPLYRSGQAVGYGLFGYAMILLLGASLGNQDPLNPLENLRSLQATQTASVSKAPFEIIKSKQELAERLDLNQQRPTLLKFSAEWCLSCHVMERTLFSDPEVQPFLKQMTLLEADVTKNDATDKALQQSLQVFAPPTLIFFDPRGQELKKLRIIAETDKPTFIRHLKAALTATPAIK